MPVETIIKEPSEEQILTDSGFSWREGGGVKVLVCDALETAGFANGFSTRVGGVSAFPEGDLNLAGFNEDDAANIYENRRRFLRLFGEYRLALVWQVHGDTIHRVDGVEDAGDSGVNADAVISNAAGILAGAKTADCVPVLIGDPVTKAFAAVHAGWRGTVRSIVSKALDALSENYGCDPSNVIAAIGPAACGRSYEVGSDVIEQFDENFSDAADYFTPTREGHALVDLHLANARQLLNVGVREENIYTAPFCTMERPDLFFSYRIEKKMNGKTGRLLSVIGRKQAI